MVNCEMLSRIALRVMTLNVKHAFDGAGFLLVRQVHAAEETLRLRHEEADKLAGSIENYRTELKR